MSLDTEVVDEPLAGGPSGSVAEEPPVPETAAHMEPEPPTEKGKTAAPPEAREETKSKGGKRPASRKGMEWSNGVHEHSQIKMARDIFGAEIVEIISLQDEGLD